MKTPDSSSAFLDRRAFLARAGIVELFRADARVLREWLGVAPV